MADYAGNSKKAKAKDQPEKKIQQVTTGEVLIQKKGVGAKFKDFFIATDFKTVITYVIWDVCLPALKNMVVDGASRGVERMMYGERAVQRGYRASHVSYQSPVQRGYSGIVTRDNLDRRGIGAGPGAGQRPSRQSLNTGIVVSTKDEADSAIEQMINIVDQFGSVTVGDLYHMVGLTATHVDETWGWGEEVRNAQVQQIREGYLLDLPQPQPLRDA